MAAQAIAYGAMAGLQLAGGYFAAQNIKATAELNRDIDRMNAEFAELDAYDATAEGFSNEARYQKVIDNALADQDTVLKAQDVDTSFGTAAALQDETRFIGELNLMDIEKQAQETAMGYRREARKILLGSSLDYAAAKTKAGQVMFESAMGAAKTGLTGYERSR